MHTDSFIRWLEEKGLYSAARNHSAPFRHVLESCMMAGKKKLLIVTDYGLEGRMVAPLVSAGFYLAASRLGMQADIVAGSIKKSGQCADVDVTKALMRHEPNNVVVASVSNWFGEVKARKGFRRYAQEKRQKFITMTGLGSILTDKFYSITEALNVDYAKLSAAAQRLKESLDNGRELRLKGSSGSDMTFDISGRQATSIDGDYSSKLGGNMPAGEVYIAPKSGSANGVAVIDGSSRNRNGTAKADRPITFTIRNGIASSIQGGIAASMLKQTIAWAERKAQHPSSVRQVGEVGIGLNPHLGIIGAMIADEKAYGTAHIALGSNHWFGGDIFTIVHLDQVFRNPTLYIDGEEYHLPGRNELL